MARRLNGLDVDYVGAQNRDGGYAAAEHLYSHGCRRIAFVGGFTDSSAREERAGGVAAFLNDHGLSLTADHSVVCEPARPQAREAAMALLTKDPDVDGIVCFSDVVAFGVLDAIADMGRTVGSEVRVIGFDDVHDAGLNRPSLSSVAVPARRPAAGLRSLCWSELPDLPNRPYARSFRPSSSRGRPAAAPVPNRCPEAGHLGGAIPLCAPCQC